MTTRLECQRQLKSLGSIKARARDRGAEPAELDRIEHMITLARAEYQIRMALASVREQDRPCLMERLAA